MISTYLKDRTWIYENWLEAELLHRMFCFPCQGQLRTTSEMETSQQSPTTDFGWGSVDGTTVEFFKQCVNMVILTRKVANFIGTISSFVYSPMDFGVLNSGHQFSDHSRCFSEI